jgi:hypothetical protein
MTTDVKPILTRYDDSFSIHLSRTYDLSILVGRDRFSFCFNRHDDNCLVGIESYSFNISDPNLTFQNDVQEWCRELSLLLETQEALKKSFHKVQIAVECHKSTLIPQEIFNIENQHELLSFNHPIEESEVCCNELLPHMESVLIYALPSCILAALQASFPEAEISNASGQMIENLFKTSQIQTGDGMLYANVGGTWVEIICIENNKLRYINSFNYRTREDLAYYIIFVMEQLGLNPDTITLVLMGNIERESERFELLYRYIRNIRLIDKSLTKVGKQMGENIPVSNYFNLLSFARCV